MHYKLMMMMMMMIKKNPILSHALLTPWHHTARSENGP